MSIFIFLLCLGLFICLLLYIMKKIADREERERQLRWQKYLSERDK